VKPLLAGALQPPPLFDIAATEVNDTVRLAGLPHTGQGTSSNGLRWIFSTVLPQWLQLYSKIGKGNISIYMIFTHSINYILFFDL